MIHFKKALAIASAILCLNLSVYSQTVTLNVNNVTVKEAMEQLKKTSGYAFVFSSNDVNTKSRVSISVKNASLDEVINQILKGQSGLAYDIQGNNIVVKKQSSQQVKDGVKKTVKGKVVDAKGEPVIGATVMEKGTPNGTITDFDGNFSLVVTTDAPLEISYIGFTSQQLKPQVGKLMSVTLKENTETLDEVVVVGFGTQKKVNLTGAVASVNSEALENKPVGSIADFSNFSFHAVKNFTTAEGGAVAWKDIDGIDNEEIYHQYQLLSLHGQSKDALAKTQLGAWEYDIVGPWYKCNMTDVTAGIGLAQMKRYKGLLARRKEIIGKYDEAFKPLGIEALNHYTEDHQSSGHLYITRVHGISLEQRQEIIVKMAEEGIACNVHYKPLAMMTAYKNMGFDIKDYPNAYKRFENEITLPLHTKLTDEEVEYVIEKYCAIVKQYI